MKRALFFAGRGLLHRAGGARCEHARRDADHDHDRRHRSDHRPGRALRFGRPRRRRVLQVRERARRSERAQDQVPVSRRRVRPGEDGAADAPARRAGTRLRDLQQRRHGQQPCDPRLPERRAGATALRRHGHVTDRRRLQGPSVDDGLPPELPLGRRHLRQSDRRLRRREGRGALGGLRVRQGHGERPQAGARREGRLDRRVTDLRADRHRDRLADVDACTPPAPTCSC